jgi:hypothetical protein
MSYYDDEDDSKAEVQAARELLVGGSTGTPRRGTRS